MSKANLEKILSDISTKVKSHREDELNKESHVYSVNYTSIVKEVINEINTIGVKFPSSVVEPSVKTYCEKVYTSLKGGHPGYSIIVGGSHLSFSAIIRARAGAAKSSSPFSIIGVKRRGALSNLKDSLSAAMRDYIKSTRKAGNITNKQVTDVKNILYGSTYTNSAGVTSASGGLLERGHTAGGSAVEHELLPSNIAFGNEIRKLSTQSKVVDSILMDMKFNIITNPKQGGQLRNGKLVVFIYDQGKRANNDQSNAEESYLRKNFQKVIREVLDKVDFAGLETSPNIPSLVVAKIGKVAKKHKFKTNIKTAIADKTYNTTASSQVKARLLTTTMTESLSNSMKFNFVTSRQSEKRRNWSALLPVINSKLADRVRANMHSPRLVNRTGRFANSAQVVGVHETEQGYPSFIIDYERDPYNVFDPIVGRAPWNTPERNPRALVELSVRQIVQELAIGRFYVRRS